MNIKTIIALAIPFVFLNLHAQTLEEAGKALKKIDKLEDLEKFKAEHPHWNISIDKTMDSDSLEFPEVVNAQIRDVVLKQYNANAPKFIMKVLEIGDEELCRVKHIYLNGRISSKSEIDSLRSLIIMRFNSGEDFELLVKEYSMYKQPTGTGDLGWFCKGMMVDTFDAAVRNRKKGEIFIVDVPENNWYYVILKTHDNKIEKAKISVMVEYSE